MIWDCSHSGSGVLESWRKHISDLRREPREGNPGEKQRQQQHHRRDFSSSPSSGNSPPRKASCFPAHSLHSRLFQFTSLPFHSLCSTWEAAGSYLPPRWLTVAPSAASPASRGKEVQPVSEDGGVGRKWQERKTATTLLLPLLLLLFSTFFFFNGVSLLVLLPLLLLLLCPVPSPISSSTSSPFFTSFFTSSFFFSCC